MFKVLELGSPEWIFNVMGLGPTRRDLHLDQRILCPYVAAYGWRAGLALTTEPGAYIAQPILVTKDGELRHSYNFGGPIGSDGTLSETDYPFDHAYNLKEWAKKQGCTKEYCTLVPNLANEQVRLLGRAGITPEFRKNSVIVDLNEQKVRGTTRRLANKASGAGAAVKQYDYSHLKHFIDIYNVTMNRVKAKEHWYFPDKWFEAFARFVKPCLMLAEYEGKFEAGCLIVYSQQYPVAYYHFAGSLNTYPGLGINHQMVLSACEFVKSMNIRYLFLGGGVTDSNNDSLLVFKRGFSKSLLPVYSYQRTL